MPEVGGAVDPGSRSPRPRDVALRRHEQGRTDADQDPRPRRDGRPGRDRGPLPRRPPALRLPARRRRPAPQPGQGADRQRLHQLAPDPAAAPVVQRIFAEYLAGTGLCAIAEAPHRDGIPSPSGHDPPATRHRHGAAWASRRCGRSSPTPATPATRSGTSSADEVLARRRRRRARPRDRDALERRATSGPGRSSRFTNRWCHAPFSRPSRRSFAPTLAVAVHVPAGLRNARTPYVADSRAGSADASCRATKFAVTTTTAAATQASTHVPSSSIIRSTCTCARTTSCHRSTSGSATSSPPNAWRRL